MGGAGELRRRSAALCECGQLGTRRCVDVSWTVEIVINVYSDMRAATAQRALSRRRRRLVRPCRASRQMPPGATITDIVTYIVYIIYPAPRQDQVRVPMNCHAVLGVFAHLSPHQLCWARSLPSVALVTRPH